MALWADTLGLLGKTEVPESNARYDFSRFENARIITYVAQQWQ